MTSRRILRATPPCRRGPPSRTSPCGPRSFARWPRSWPPGSRRRARSFLSTWRPSSVRSVISTTDGGWPMTGATAGRRWRRRTWTGRSRTPASTTRRLRGGLGQFPDARIVCRRTMSHNPVRVIRTGHGLGGSPRDPIIEVRDPVGRRPLGVNRQSNPVGVIMPEPVGWHQQGAAISTAAWTVAALIHGPSARAEAAGDQPVPAPQSSGHRPPMPMARQAHTPLQSRLDHAS